METRDERRLARRRSAMVEFDLRGRGIRSERVLEAMSRVPRHAFVSPELTEAAYGDHPLPIGGGQTISQPYIVALMTEALDIDEGSKVLELGTGSGYQTAILAEMAASVWTVERSPRLHEQARARLAALGYDHVHSLCGDGTLGWPDEAPFDRILATGSLPSVPECLLAQLALGGLFIGPVGRLLSQRLVCMAYDPAGSARRDLGPCRFVPLVGDAGWAASEPWQKDLEEGKRAKR